MDERLIDIAALLNFWGRLGLQELNGMPVADDVFLFAQDPFPFVFMVFFADAR